MSAAEGRSIGMDFSLILVPLNVGFAISIAQAWGINILSGIEINGVKDPRKVVSFACQAHIAATHQQ